MRLVKDAIPALALGFLLLPSGCGSPSRADSTKAPAASRNFVIVELFTSEGCSSCPPADALLKTISEQQSVPGADVLALEEHVDYWDHLGWRDPYSNSTFTERQEDYARSFGNSGSYTPQMIVDGAVEFVGSRSRQARQAIEEAAAKPKARVQIVAADRSTRQNAIFNIRISELSSVKVSEDRELWIAITETGLHSDVKAGENSGESLQHAAVVREIRKLESFRASNDHATVAAVQLATSWKPEHLALVAFVVDKPSRKVIGAGSAGIAQAAAGN